MNNAQELIEMLKLIYESGEIMPMCICMENNYPPLKTTVLPDVSYESFQWVLREAIKYIENNESYRWFG